MKNFYSQNKKCLKCEKPIANQNKQGYCRKCYLALFRVKNRDHTAEYHKEKYLKNKREINSKIKERYHSDPVYRIKDILRSRVRHLIKSKAKRHSHVKNLGCSVEELQIYLESKFQPGMTWENHGRYGWHIDHIRPLSSFDLENSVEFKQACHYTNLQPLWCNDNLSKSNKYED
jgi:hypothetical protein